jgi:predicted phage-related endonuclease
VPLDHLDAVVRELHLRRRQQAALDELVTELENELKAELRDATTGTVAGRPVVTWRASTSRRLPGLKTIAGTQLERWLAEAGLVTTTTSRRFLLKSPKE